MEQGECPGPLTVFTDTLLDNTLGSKTDGAVYTHTHTHAFFSLSPWLPLPLSFSPSLSRHLPLHCRLIRIYLHPEIIRHLHEWLVLLSYTLSRAIVSIWKGECNVSLPTCNHTHNQNRLGWVFHNTEHNSRVVIIREYLLPPLWTLACSMWDIHPHYTTHTHSTQRHLETAACA